MIPSQGFSAKWFLHVSQNWIEGPRLDFKRGLLKLYASKTEQKNWQVTKKEGDNIKKGEAARDIIAFANVARRTGKPCWVVFGVDDNERELLFDLRDEFPTRKRPSQFKTMPLSRRQEEVARQYYEFVQKWIEPHPNLRYYFGEVDGNLVAYLEILPLQTPQPFRLKRDVTTKKGKNYSASTAFIRFGDSTMEVPSNELESLTYAQVPYLEENAWKRMIGMSRHPVFETAFSWFKQFPLMDENGNNALETLLQALEGGIPHIGVVGLAGAGKSVLLHALVYELSSRHNMDAITYRKYFAQKITTGEYANLEDLEVVPQHPIPIFVHLRAKFESLDIFKKIILSQMGQKNNNETTPLEAYFRIAGSRWVLILDALDEVHNLSDFAPGLKTWIDTLPTNVQVVISQRPVVEHASTKVIRLARLGKDQCKTLLAKKLDDLAERNLLDNKEAENALQKANLLLDEHPEINDIIFSPRGVDGLIYTLTDSDTKIFLLEEIPTHSPITSSIILQETELLSQEQENKPELSNTISPPSIPQLNVPLIPPQDTIEEHAENDTILSANSPDLAETNETEQLPTTLDVTEENTISFVTYFSKMVEYLREQEADRQKMLGKSPQTLLDTAKDAIEKLAWEKEWHTDEFMWRGKWKEIMSEPTLKWNRYLGFLHRTSNSRYKYLSRFFFFFCAASYGASAIIEEYLESQTVLDTLKKKRNAQARKQVRTLLNHILQENGRPPIFPHQEANP